MIGMVGSAVEGRVVEEMKEKRVIGDRGEWE
jgi:hypothetical protein